MEPGATRPVIRPRWATTYAIVTGLLVLLLGALIFAGVWQLREKVRSQITRRDGEILKAVALMQQITGETSDDFGGDIEQFADQFNVALQVSQLNRGVIATRLYDTNGAFQTAFPLDVLPAELPPAHLVDLRRLRPVSQFHPRLSLHQIIGPDAGPPAPMLVVEIPLHRQAQGTLLGVVQFIIDGADIAAEFAALDRHLAWQSGTAFTAGAVLMMASLFWAFGRLEKSARLLLERTHRLQEANDELVLAAKTSAVGAVAAHLVHGLSSPLAGLKDLLASHTPGNAGEWQTMAETTGRMESMVHDLVRFLGEAKIESYEVSLGELIQSARARREPAAHGAGVCLKTSQEVDGILDNKQASLVLLIVDQLLENALQATPTGKTVELKAVDRPGQAVGWLISDEGSGIPAHLLDRLFTPCRSTKPEGHGVGLAIGKHLADHLGAALSLVRTTSSGCTFELTLPRVAQKSRLASSTVVR